MHYLVVRELGTMILQSKYYFHRNVNEQLNALLKVGTHL